MSIKKINSLGQSIWVDFITRDFLRSGKFEELIKQGVTGVTSNPTIFLKAIKGTSDYEEDIISLCNQGKDSIDLYEELSTQDIKVAATLLQEVYGSTAGRDGYVSIEVDPVFANRVDATVYQGFHLHQIIDCPNVMIKVPGTDAGLSAMYELLREGVNVNVTLLFSIDQYEKVARTYIRALQARHAEGLRIDRMASVASFFVSRIDTKIDKFLDDDDPACGKVAIANCKLAYEKYKEIFGSAEFVKLRKAGGAMPQRVLWASTSVKNTVFPELKYAQALVAKETVNTLPMSTLEAILKCKDGMWDRRLEHYPSYDAQGLVDRMNRHKHKPNMKLVTDELLTEGLAAFVDSHDSLMAHLYACTGGCNGVHQCTEPGSGLV